MVNDAIEVGNYLLLRKKQTKFGGSRCLDGFIVRSLIYAIGKAILCTKNLILQRKAANTMNALEIKNDLLKLLVETDDVELLVTVRNYFKQKKEEKTNKASKEPILIKKIKSAYPAKENKRYRELRAKIESGKISEKEQKELIDLTNKFEALDAQRLQYLLELAELRQQPLNLVLKEFPATSPYA